MEFIFFLFLFSYVSSIGNLPDDMCSYEKKYCENCYGSIYYGPYYTQMGARITTIEAMEKESSYFIRSGIDGEGVVCSHNATLFPSDFWELDPDTTGPKVCLCNEININWQNRAQCDGFEINTFQKVNSHVACEEKCREEFAVFKNLWTTKDEYGNDNFEMDYCCEYHSLEKECSLFRG